MTKILIGIPTYNGYRRIDSLLQSISMRTGKDIDYKIVICDDSGKKEHQNKTISLVYKWRSDLPIELIINDKNLGVAKSWNRLINSHDSEYIILINDDIIVANNWLENIIYFLDNNQNIGTAIYDCIFINEEDIKQLLSSINPIIKPRDPFTRIQIDDFDYNKDTFPLRSMVGWGCLFGFGREIYDLVGGFDEHYFAYFEEYDFLTSLASLGYSNYILRDPKNWHVWGATSKHAPELNITDTFEKSKEYYTKKWNGDHMITMNRYMSKIPFQKVKWISNNDIHEEILIDDYGYFNVKINSENCIKII